MIVSHRYKFILITPPKTGSTSLHEFLSQAPFLEEPWTPSNENQHLAEIPPGCEDYEIISTWRNPLDREVSLWGHSQSGVSRKAEGHGFFSFEHFVRSWQETAGRFYAWSQAAWMCGVVPDTVLRFDELNAAAQRLRPVQEAIADGFDIAPLRTLNRSHHRPWRMCYTPELKEIVLSRFADDVAQPCPLS